MKFIYSFIIGLLVINTAISQTTTHKNDSVVNYTDINNKKQGTWIKHYDNGNIAYKTYFINDIPVGEYKRYYYNGKVKADILYDKKPTGTGTATLYWDDGVLMATGFYKNIKVKDSIWTMYGTDGALVVRLTFKDGIKNGKEAKYFRNGRFSEVLTWKDGVKDGVWRWYYDNGQVRMETKYKMKKRDGLFRVYYETGKFYIEGRYVNDYREGKWMFYDAHGNVDKEVDYVHGVASNHAEVELELTKKLQEWEKNKGNIPEPSVDDVYGNQRR